MQTPKKTTTTATKLTVIWNCRNFRTVSNTCRPHLMVHTMLLKSSSRRMTSDASLATSVPATLCNDRWSQPWGVSLGDVAASYPPWGDGGWGRGGYFWVWCHPVLTTLKLFQTNIYELPYTIFRPDCQNVYSISDPVRYGNFGQQSL